MLKEIMIVVTPSNALKGKKCNLPCVRIKLS